MNVEQVAAWFKTTPAIISQLINEGHLDRDLSEIKVRSAMGSNRVLARASTLKKESVKNADQKARAEHARLHAVKPVGARIADSQLAAARSAGRLEARIAANAERIAELESQREELVNQLQEVEQEFREAEAQHANAE